MYDSNTMVQYQTLSFVSSFDDYYLITKLLLFYFYPIGPKVFPNYEVEVFQMIQGD